MRQKDRVLSAVHHYAFSSHLNRTEQTGHLCVFLFNLALLPCCMGCDNWCEPDVKSVMVGSAELHIEGWEEILKYWSILLIFIRLHTIDFSIHILYVRICVSGSIMLYLNPWLPHSTTIMHFQLSKTTFSTGIKFTRYILLAYTERTQAYETIYCLVYSITTYRNILDPNVSYFQILANTQSSKLA